MPSIQSPDKEKSGIKNTLLHETANSYLYLREEEGFDLPVVVKILKEEFPSPQRIIQFNNEYEFTKSIDLPGIRKSYRTEKRKGKYTLILEYIEGQTIKEIFSDPPQPVDMFLKTAISMADALKEIHQQNIIHKDINSRNILLNPGTGKVTIIDFGISSKIGVKTRHLGNPDKLEGSLAYISPEQTGRMNRVVDYRTDLYSLGVTYFEMLTGRLPFIAMDSLEMVHCHIARKPPSITKLNPSVPKQLQRIITKLMAKNAEDRYQSAYGLKADLEECLRLWEQDREIRYFELARNDLSDKFRIPQKLYGRDRELKMLMEAFDRAAGGGLEMVLVAGYSGVGKSALINEVHKPITEKRGYFISGKYDQYQRNSPYFAIQQSFNEFCNLLLTENDEVLDGWKHKILQALGTNGQVLIDIIPQLESVIGPQPAVEKLEAQEATARFNLLFQKFLRVICSREHPLVLFIDDLQWADNASLDLLKTLLLDSENRYLLILGAYRDNETDHTHPLMVMLEEAEKENGEYGAIHLSPLSEKNVVQLTADALGRPLEEIEALAKLIYSKTRGNAFFTVEFLKSLEEKDCITFDFKTQKWVADLEQIRRMEITGNVVELMAGKIHDLPSGTEEALKYAACIGNNFDLRVLTIILRKNLIITLATLWRAVEEGLLMPDNDNYKLLSVAEEENVSFDLGFTFLHDRVQQAAYSLINEQERKATHWRIGQLLLENTTNVDEQVFNIVNQLNAGRDMASGESDRIRLIELNFLAGKKAKDATANRSAMNFLDLSIELSKVSDWVKYYQLTFEVHKLAAEVSYLNGELEKSEELIETCLKKAGTPHEKSDIYYLLMLRQSLSNLYEEAIGTARKALGLLGFNLPSDELERHIQENMGWLVNWFEENSIDRIYGHPVMNEPEKLAIIKILDNLSMPTYVSGQVNLWILHVLLKVRLSIEQGNAPETAYAFSELGLIFCIFGNWQLAFPCADLSKRLSEKFEHQSLRHKARSFHLIANYISPWRMHYRDTHPINNESYRTSLESGEVIFVGYTLFHPFYNQFFTGHPTLPELFERTGASLQSARNIKHDLAFNTIRAMRMFLLNLMDVNGNETTFEDEQLTESKFMEECTRWKDFYSICAYCVFKAKILYLYRQFEAAWGSLEQGSAMLAVLSGHAAGLGTFTYTQSLTALAMCDEATPSQRKDYLATVNENLEKFSTWAANCPDNFEHKRLLIAAEKARVEGAVLEAVKLYNAAIESAQQYGYIQEESLAHELVARFFLKNKVPQYAKPHLKNAHHGYLSWGATRKAVMLENEFPQILAEEKQQALATQSGTAIPVNTTHSTRAELDTFSIVKASQALSSEIVLENLLRRMMEIVLENAGAQKAVLILEKGGDWYVKTVGRADDHTIVLPELPASQSDELPLTVLNYLLHTNDHLVIDDVRKQNRFSRDPYLRKNKPLSILGMSILHQGKKEGILYLENSLTTGAFPSERVETLRLLTSQMAVSLENAYLYNRQQDLVQAYARFVPHKFLKTLGHESILDISLGDQVAQNMTVLFSDIRSYTSLSETMTPEENFNFINGYLKRIGPNITRYDGFISQYFGDGIMAMFPKPEQAVKAAIGMRRGLAEYNVERKNKNRIPIQMGIGVHTGNLMLGIIGDEHRHDVGVISDVVNCASRIEGLTKYFGVPVIITEDTLSGVPVIEKYDYRFLGRVQVKGKEGVVPVYEIFEGESDDFSRLKGETAQLFRQGLEEYFNKNFAEAALYLKKTLTANPRDRVAEHYLRQAAMFMVGGVPDDWTGVEKMEDK